MGHIQNNRLIISDAEIIFLADFMMTGRGIEKVCTYPLTELIDKLRFVALDRINIELFKRLNPPQMNVYIDLMKACVSKRVLFKFLSDNIPEFDFLMNGKINKIQTEFYRAVEIVKRSLQHKYIN